MLKSSDKRNVDGITTVLGKSTVFDGTMRFTKSLKIDGSFKGKIISTGFLYIEEGAVVTADIKVGSVVIGGVVYGNVEASENLEMLTTGQVFGNIKTAKLRIADGVVFEGKCEMIKNPETVDIFSYPVEKLKSKLQSV